MGGSMVSFLQAYIVSCLRIEPIESAYGIFVTLVPYFPSVAIITYTLLPSLAYFASTLPTIFSSSGWANIPTIVLAKCGWLKDVNAIKIFNAVIKHLLIC